MPMSNPLSSLEATIEGIMPAIAHGFDPSVD